MDLKWWAVRTRRCCHHSDNPNSTPATASHPPSSCTAGNRFPSSVLRSVADPLGPRRETRSLDRLESHTNAGRFDDGVRIEGCWMKQLWILIAETPLAAGERIQSEMEESVSLELVPGDLPGGWQRRISRHSSSASQQCRSGQERSAREIHRSLAYPNLSSRTRSLTLVLAFNTLKYASCTSLDPRRFEETPSLLWRSHDSNQSIGGTTKWRFVDDVGIKWRTRRQLVRLVAN